MSAHHPSEVIAVTFVGPQIVDTIFDDRRFKNIGEKQREDVNAKENQFYSGSSNGS